MSNACVLGSELVLNEEIEDRSCVCIRVIDDVASAVANSVTSVTAFLDHGADHLGLSEPDISQIIENGRTAESGGDICLRCASTITSEAKASVLPKGEEHDYPNPLTAETVHTAVVVSLTNCIAFCKI